MYKHHFVFPEIKFFFQSNSKEIKVKGTFRSDEDFLASVENKKILHVRRWLLELSSSLLLSFHVHNSMPQKIEDV